MKLWQKGSGPQEWLIRFTVGSDNEWDTLLLPFDIQGTSAHVNALVTMGLISKTAAIKIHRALKKLLVDVEEGKVVVTVADEDSHTVIENYLTKTLGKTGQKVHAGRSRNDQVLVSTRLYGREALLDVGDRLRSVVEALCGLAEKFDDIIMPGYTHAQPAMPSTPGLWAAGYAELLIDDISLLEQAYKLLNRSPWGSAAGYGIPYLKMPRKQVEKELGFDSTQENVTAVQLSRGKIEATVVHALSQMGLTLNRLASDLVLFNTNEYSFVVLPDEFCTGSSIMPQKKNPDLFELARANYHRLSSELHLLMTLPANLGSGYHRDLQLTKESFIRSLILSRDLAAMFERSLPGISFDKKIMELASSSGLFATADAMQRVSKGATFREAYRETAKNLDNIHSLDSAEALKAYKTKGYPGKANVAHLRKGLSKAVRWIER